MAWLSLPDSLTASTRTWATLAAWGRPRRLGERRTHHGGTERTEDGTEGPTSGRWGVDQALGPWALRRFGRPPQHVEGRGGDGDLGEDAGRPAEPAAYGGDGVPDLGEQSVAGVGEDQQRRDGDGQGREGEEAEERVLDEAL